MLRVDDVNYNPREMHAFITRSGDRIINLASGVNFAPPPAEVLHVVASAVADSSFFLDYDGPAGNELGRRAILMAEEMRSREAWRRGDWDVIVTAGASAGFHLLALTLAAARPRATALIPVPTFPLAGASLSFVGFDVLEVDHDADDDDRAIPTPSEFRARADERVGAIYVNLFNNPTGELFSADEIRQIVRLASETDAYLIADVVSADLTAGKPAPNMLDIVAEEGYASRTCVVGSLSKERSVPGFRIGWVISSPEIIGEMTRLNELVAPSSPAVSSAFLLVDMLSRAALSLDEEQDLSDRCGHVSEAFRREVQTFLDIHAEMGPFLAAVLHPEALRDLVRVYEAWRRDLETLLQRNWATLRDRYGGAMHAKGAWMGDFNTFVNVAAARPRDYLDVTHDLFRTTGVQILPGPAFGLTPSRWEAREGLWTRLSFALEPAVWEEGLSKLVDFVTA